MKTITSTLIAVATIGSAFGTTGTSKALSSSTKSFVTGLYAGMELGYIHEGHRYKENRFGQLYGNGNQVFVSTGSKKSNSFLPGIFAGYRHAVGPVFLGYELSANLNNSKSKATFMGIFNDKAKHSYKAKYNIIPAFVVGTPIPTVDGLNVYGKLGFDIGQYHHRITESNGISNNSKSSSKILGRVLIALGTEYAINKTLSTRFEISHSFGNSSKFKMVGKLPGDTSYKTSLKTSTTTAKVGVFVKI